MKYMLIMNTPADGYQQYMSWPKRILEANMAFMHQFTEKLREAGELVGTWGLASPVEAKLVRVGKNGKPVTDGVFPESKEFLAGFWLVDVDSAERAYQLAAEVSSAPGGTVKSASGAPVEHFWIEVREVMGSGNDMR
jgi:hypothetical protein